jgi:hypothetical protein
LLPDTLKKFRISIIIQISGAIPITVGEKYIFIFPALQQFQKGAAFYLSDFLFIIFKDGLKTSNIFLFEG